MNHIHHILLMLLLSVSPGAAESFLLLDDVGTVTPVQVTIIGPDEVELMDPETGFGTTPRGNCIAFVRPTPASTSIDRPTVLLRDGQRFPGRPSDATEQDHLLWDHEWLGTLRIPVDRIDRIVLSGSSRIRSVSPESDVDTVHLVNGDVVEGFILTISPRVEIEIDSDSGSRVVEIPHDRIKEIDLFGDTEPGSDPRVWTNDGTTATLEVLEVASDGYLRIGDHALRRGGVSTMLSGPPLRTVHALSYSGSRIIPIGSLPVDRLDTPPTRIGSVSRQVTDPAAPLGLSPIEYRGPMSIEYTLPDGPHHLYSTVRMPASATRWGDCELVVLMDGRELHRSTFNADRLETRLDLLVDGGTLEFRLLEGANGPVQDRLRFEYGILVPVSESTP